MKLYDYSGAPNARRVRIFLAEKGINLPIEKIDITAGEQRTPDFLAKNPFGAVPVLELADGTCIAESMAICRYLESLYPEPNLLGHGALEQAMVEMWNRRIELGFFKQVASYFQNSSEFMRRSQQFPEYGEYCKNQALKSLEWFNEHFVKSTYVVGERFTVADITLICGLDFAKFSGIVIPKELMHLLAWAERLYQNPHIKA